MRVALDCIPCLFNQGLFAARRNGCSDAQQRELMNAIALQVPALSMDATPPEISVDLYRIIRKVVGKADPFVAIKKASNEAALSVYPELKTRITRSDDPLREAVQVAIAGNIIDYGANIDIDLHKEIKKILEAESSVTAGEDGAFFNLESFREALGRAGSVIYLGDNAGEIVFDRVLIETIRNLFPSLSIRFAVRGEPIINDVTMEDALQVGMDRVCPIIDSGSPAPGAVPELCSSGFQKTLDEAEMIISKGQGNYEALSHRGLPVFFLLRIKCRVLAEDIGAKQWDVCLFRQ